MRKQTLTLALAITAVACIADIGAVQGCALYAGGEDYSATAVWVAATAAKDHLRFASLGIAQRMRLQILSQAGDLVFDSDFRDGNLLDWQLDDGHGNRLPDGVYGC